MIKSLLTLTILVTSSILQASDLTDSCKNSISATAISATMDFMVKNGDMMTEKPISVGQPERYLTGMIDQNTGISVDEFDSVVTVVMNSNPETAAAIRYYAKIIVEFNNKTGDCSVVNKGNVEVETEN